MRLNGGSWFGRNVPLLWRIDGVDLPVTASECEVVGSDNVSNPQTLSGKVVLARNREYAEAGRASIICDSPKRITLTFPRLPVDLYHFLRNRRTFHRAFTVEIHTLDAIDRELLFAYDLVNYYGSVGGWKPGTVALWLNGVPHALDGSDGAPSFTVNHPWGIIKSSEVLAWSDVLELRYTWAPTVIATGTLEPTFRAGIKVPEAGVKIELQEIRPRQDASLFV